jgi:two-component system, chemotaxis family, protein-glutamate methylesterase/glutaminase
VSSAVPLLSRTPAPAIVAIGASAGAVDALGQILPQLLPTFPVPVLIVVHVPADRRSALPALFGRTCAVATTEAEDKMRPEPSTVYFAPPDYHLLVEADGSLALSVDDAVHHSRPSIDVLFESVATVYGPRALGILLSGASRDGADGLARIRDAGGQTWVQEPDTAQMAVMPRAALALAPHVIADPRSIGLALAAWSDTGD